MASAMRCFHFRVPSVTAVVILCGFLPGAAAQTTAAPAAWALAEAGRLTYEGEINQRAVAAGSRIVFTTRSGWIYAVETATMTVAWRYAVGAPISRPPAVSDRYVAVIDEANTLHCLTAGGILNWSFRAEGPSAVGPVFLGPAIVIGLRSGGVIALAGEHPRELWRSGDGDAPIREIAVWRGRLLVAGSDGRIAILGADGRIDGALDAGGPISGALTLDEDVLYVGRRDGLLCALDLAAAKVRWRMRLGGTPNGPGLIDERRLFLAADSGVLFALNKNGGDILWWRPLPSRMVFAPILWQGRLAAASISPILSSYRPATGEPLGDYKNPGDADADPMIRDGRLLLHVYDADRREGTLLFLAPPAKSEPIKGVQ
jgi:outer membrane protein assembly factor BamB